MLLNTPINYITASDICSRKKRRRKTELCSCVWRVFTLLGAPLITRPRLNANLRTQPNEHFLYPLFSSSNVFVSFFFLSLLSLRYVYLWSSVSIAYYFMWNMDSHSISFPNSDITKEWINLVLYGESCRNIKFSDAFLCEGLSTIEGRSGKYESTNELKLIGGMSVWIYTFLMIFSRYF